MLMGLPEDYWEQEHIDTILGPFARSISFDKDPDHLARLIVRARVTDLESIPHFSVFSDSPGYDAQSWAVQIEILQHENLGIGPPDEDAVPLPLEGQDPPPFDFFGLGQQVLAPVAAYADQLALEAQGDLIGEEKGHNQDQNNPEGMEFGLDWPDELPAQQQVGGQQLDLNLAPVRAQQDPIAPPPLVVAQDLNEIPMIEDPQ